MNKILRTRFNHNRKATPCPWTGEERTENLVVYDKVSDSYAVYGKRDRHAFINAPLESTLISTKIRAFSNGDPLALGGGKETGIYADITGLPTDHNSLHALTVRANQLSKQSGFDNVSDLVNHLVNTEVKTLSDTDNGGNNDNEQK